MTARIKSFVVTLDQDYREDDLDDIVTALEQIKGVIDVEKRPAGTLDHQARVRIRRELIEQIWDVLQG